ncbi:hypothetical protein [Pseudomonas sp. JR33AA]|uniref:hypothetical protein n=1 Tax=Pseudomonas sp. JR33AA TaxID=2899113 RepID=UPI001F1D9842|nr:hypothetical protein [Pseudomonas sp. JR33AA]MCE5979525.1 hypothetical protein [Pseudomonas sp. JR33AA]
MYTTSEIFCKPVFPHFFPFVASQRLGKTVQETCLIGQLMTLGSAAALYLRPVGRFWARIAGRDRRDQKIVYNFAMECLNGVIPAHRRPYGVAMAVYFLPTD